MLRLVQRDREIAERLVQWYGSNARDLPWRRDRNGYTALVAEAMLQQTQVARVLERYGAFLKRFPTVQALAQADEQDVLAAWQGLGYYRRARHLHAAAQMIVQEHDGSVPTTAAELRRLPGVGRYTAGAIASIVYARREPIVDGNVHRVLMRLEARRIDTHETSQRSPDHAWTWRRAEELVQQADNPGISNEALMEVGATVCTPAAPRCPRCPLAKLCRARAEGVQDQIPAPKPSARRIEVHHHAVIVRRRDLVLLERRQRNCLWSEMWQTPTVESRTELETSEVLDLLDTAVTHVRRVGRFTYLTTHRRVVFHILTAGTRTRRGVWRNLDAIELPMSNAHRRVLSFARSVDDR